VKVLMQWIHCIGYATQRSRGYLLGSNLAAYFGLSLSQCLTRFFVRTLITNILPEKVHEQQLYFMCEKKI
jgi:hypothetical protein